jgi:hypothetical protein
MVMNREKTGIGIFLVGIFFMLMHTTVPFLWALFGIGAPYPLASDEGFLFYFQGFSPVVGAILLVVGGLVYSGKGGNPR